MDPIARLLSAAPRFPAPWLAHAEAYRQEPAGLALVLAEYARYLNDLGQAGAVDELAACLAAIELALAGEDQAVSDAVSEHVLGAIVHMPHFPVEAALGPATRARLRRAGSSRDADAG